VIQPPDTVEVAPAPRPAASPTPDPVVAPEPRPVTPPTPDPVIPPRPAPSTPASPLQWASVRGRITLANAPKPQPIRATTDAEFCTKDGPLLDESLVVGPTGGVKNVVVWLRPDTTVRTDPFPADRIHPALAAAPPVERVIDQPCCQFEPRVLAARAGDRLVILNSAKVVHHVSLSPGDENAALAFGVNLPSGGKHTVTAPLAAQRTPIPFKCDIHPWMKGFVRVFDHPYFAVTDADGVFVLRDAPVGKWRLVVWHENGFHRGRDGVLGLPIEVTGANLPAVELELPKP
jgi:plastocyanin